MTETNLKSFDFTEFVKDILIFVDKDLCNGCGLCAEVCPFGLHVQTGHVRNSNRTPCLERQSQAHCQP